MRQAYGRRALLRGLSVAALVVGGRRAAARAIGAGLPATTKSGAADAVATIVKDDGEANEYPPAAPGRTFLVGSRDEFLARYDRAVGGDHIIVRNGINLGTLALTRSGDGPSRPIVIRVEGAIPSRATAYLGGALSLTGNYNTLWGIRAMAQTVYVSGQGCRLRRVLFQGARIKTDGPHPGQCILDGRDIAVEYCEMSDCDSRGFRFERNARACKILHCYIHDFNFMASDQTYEPIQVGEGANTFRWFADPADGHEIGWCYIENCNQYNRENEAISIKAPFTLVHDCHVHNARNIQLRCARNTRLERVLVTGNGFVGIQGPDHVLQSVWADNEAGIRLHRGNWNSDDPGIPPSGAKMGQPQYPSCTRTRLIGCKGNIEVGYRHSDQGGTDYRVTDLRIEGHFSGRISNAQGGSQEWTEVFEPSGPVAAPPTYRANSQGLLADL